MPAGFQLFDRAGHLIVDTNYMTYSLATKGTVAQAYLAPGTDIGTFRIIYDGGAWPMLFYKLRTTTGVAPLPAGLIRTISNNGHFEWYFDNGWPGTHGDQLMDYYIFDVASAIATPAGRAGFEAYNRQGQRIFTGATPPLNVRYARMPPPAPSNNQGGYYPYTSDGNWNFYDNGLPAINYAIHVTFPRVGLVFDGSSEEHFAEYVRPTQNGYHAAATRLGDYIGSGNRKISWDWQMPTVRPLILFINADEY